MLEYFPFYSWLFEVIVISAVVIFSYKYLSRNFGFFEKLGLKGPKPVIIFGNHLDQLFASKPDLEVQRMRKYGKIYGIFEGSRPIIQVADPAVIKQIMMTEFTEFNSKYPVTQGGHWLLSQFIVTQTGDRWRRTRAAIGPAFTAKQARSQSNKIAACVDNYLVPQLRAHAQSSAPADVRRVFGQFALSTASLCVLGEPIDPYNDVDHPFVRHSWPLMRAPTWMLYALQLLPNRLLSAVGLQSSFPEKHLRHIFNQMLHILRTKEQTAGSANDMLYLMMRSNQRTKIINQVNDLDKHSHNLNETNKPTDKQLSDEELVAQAFFAFTTAFDSMANLLSFMAYELALRPDIQQRLHQEIVDAMTDTDGQINDDELSRLPFLDAVVNETLRLHASPVKLRRMAGRDTTLAGTGINIKKGQPIELAIYAVHHSDEYFPDADTFNPDRFLNESAPNKQSYTFVPFSVGPRVCVGKSFAVLETKLALALVVKSFRFSISKQTVIPPEVKTHPMLKALGSMVLSIESRH